MAVSKDPNTHPTMAAQIFIPNDPGNGLTTDAQFLLWKHNTKNQYSIPIVILFEKNNLEDPQHNKHKASVINMCKEFKGSMNKHLNEN